MDIMTLKELLGHERIETTMIYLHIAQSGRRKPFSPLDTLFAACAQNTKVAHVLGSIMVQSRIIMSQQLASPNTSGYQGLSDSSLGVVMWMVVIVVVIFRLVTTAVGIDIVPSVRVISVYNGLKPERQNFTRSVFSCGVYLAG
ncbi:MAG: hypothetical protein IPG18_15925 [Saprospiraceae bacterium]|nr:hypothetical protein [Saprospiraceae bacterium]